MCESNILVNYAVPVKSVDKLWKEFKLAVLKENFNSKLCTPAQEDILYTLSIKEVENGKSVVIDIYANCLRGVCTYMHYIGGVIAQPCRVFC